MDVGYYFRLVLRRLPLVLLFVALGSAAGLWLALTLPPVFRSEAVLVVESEQIPDELAASTVQTNELEALQIIRQRVLARDVLLDMVERLDVYARPPGEEAVTLTPDQRVEDMRRRITFQTTGGDNRGRVQATIVNVGFEDSNPARAAQVANEVVTLILQENVEMRTSVAGDTLDFFNDEVERLDLALSRLSAEILAFQEQNLAALPDSLDFRRNRQAALQERLLQMARDETQLQDRRDQLVALYETTGQTELPQPGRPAPAPRRQLTAAEQELAQLRQEYSSLGAVLAPSNPRMTVLEARIAALEVQVAEEAATAPLAVGDEETEAAPVGLTLFDIQLADIDAQLSYIVEQRAAIEEQMAELDRTIEATPGNAVTLDALQRDYVNVQEQYNRAVANRARAETGNVIESLSKGQRITVVEQAVPPSQPTDPNRRAIAIAGFGGGLMLGIALVALLELLNTTVRRPQDIEKALGIDVFGAIPYIRTSAEVRRRRVLVAVSVVVIVAAVSGGLWYVDQEIRPLQPMLQSLLDRINLAQAL